MSRQNEINPGSISAKKAVISAKITSGVLSGKSLTQKFAYMICTSFAGLIVSLSEKNAKKLLELFDPNKTPSKVDVATLITNEFLSELDRQLQPERKQRQLLKRQVRRQHNNEKPGEAIKQEEVTKQAETQRVEQLLKELKQREEFIQQAYVGDEIRSDHFTKKAKHFNMIVSTSKKTIIMFRHEQLKETCFQRLGLKLDGPNVLKLGDKEYFSFQKFLHHRNFLQFLVALLEDKDKDKDIKHEVYQLVKTLLSHNNHIRDLLIVIAKTGYVNSLAQEQHKLLQSGKVSDVTDYNDKLTRLEKAFDYFKKTFILQEKLAVVIHKIIQKNKVDFELLKLLLIDHASKLSTLEHFIKEVKQDVNDFVAAKKREQQTKCDNEVKLKNYRVKIAALLANNKDNNVVHAKLLIYQRIIDCILCLIAEKHQYGCDINRVMMFMAKLLNNKNQSKLTTTSLATFADRLENDESLTVKDLLKHFQEIDISNKNSNNPDDEEASNPEDLTLATRFLFFTRERVAKFLEKQQSAQLDKQGETKHEMS